MSLALGTHSRLALMKILMNRSDDIGSTLSQGATDSINRHTLAAAAISGGLISWQCTPFSGSLASTPESHTGGTHPGRP